MLSNYCVQRKTKEVENTSVDSIDIQVLAMVVLFFVLKIHQLEICKKFLLCFAIYEYNQGLGIREALERPVEPLQESEQRSRRFTGA